MEVCREILGDEIVFRPAGRKEVYYTASVEANGRPLILYIYDDEAQFDLNDKAVRFEKWDYKSAAALIEDFSRRLREELRSIRKS